MAGLSKSLVEVGISMVLQDEFSKQAGRISGSYNQMINDMQQWNRAVTQSAGAAFDYGMRAIEGMTEAYRHYANISGEMFMVGKIAGATKKEQAELLNQTRQLNLETPLTNTDIVSGERFLAMAGNTTEEIKNMMGPAGRLASVFQMAMGGKGGTADLLTNIMKTFGIASSEAEKTSDILYTATTNANISLTDLAQSLQYSGAVFRNAGYDLSTASAAIGILGDQGIQASSAGTALANMIRYLTLSITGQKAKGTDMLKSMGISRDELVDAQGNLRNLGDVMKVITDRMDKLSGIDRAAAMYNIFGVRGERAASALFYAMRDGSDKMARVINEANNSDGVLGQTMADYLNTDLGAIQQLTSAIDNLKYTIGNQTDSIFLPLVHGATTLVRLLDSIAQSGFGRVAIVMGTAMTITSTLINGFRLFRGLLAMVNYQATMMRASTGGATAGMAGMNTQATLLEAHLRTIVALMAEYVAMSYAPGTRGMMLPMGGRLGRNRRGKPYISFGGKTLSTGTYAGKLGTKPKTTSNSGGTGKGPAGGGLGSNLMGFGSMAMMMMGGPWGIGIGALLGVGSLIASSLEDNTDALNSNTSKLTEAQILQEYQSNYVKALQAVIEVSKKSNNNNQTLNIKVNGVNAGSYGNGDTVPLDDYSFYY